MKSKQQQYAEDLETALIGRFAASADVSEVRISDSGPHCLCIMKRGNLVCKTWCIDWGGAEYLTLFVHDINEVAAGRTVSLDDTSGAIADWLQGDGIGELYDRYLFIDQQKRELSALVDEILNRYPDLAKAAPPKITKNYYDIHSLKFLGSERSCYVSFYGRKEFPDANFYWDDCKLFGLSIDDMERFGAILNRWLCERAMPSELRREFPGIEIGQLADYYEQGNAVEGEFIQSWDEITAFYSERQFANAPAIVEFISQMRARGYDKSLRAGQSLNILIVSRSRRNGLEDGQPNIVFDFYHKHGFVIYANNVGRRRKFMPSEIEFTDEIDAQLKKLEAKPID